MKAPPWGKEYPHPMEASSKPPAATTRIADVARLLSQRQQWPNNRTCLTINRKEKSPGMQSHLGTLTFTLDYPPEPPTSRPNSVLRMSLA